MLLIKRLDSLQCFYSLEHECSDVQNKRFDHGLNFVITGFQFIVMSGSTEHFPLQQTFIVRGKILRDLHGQ